MTKRVRILPSWKGKYISQNIGEREGTCSNIYNILKYNLNENVTKLLLTLEINRT